jgi:signal transduction histidine kinase
LGKDVSELGHAGYDREVGEFIEQVVHSGQTCGLEHNFEIRASPIGSSPAGIPCETIPDRSPASWSSAWTSLSSTCWRNACAIAHKLEAIGRLAGGVAHEFNNLLTVINGYCEMLLFGSEEAQSPWHSEVAEIHRAGTRAAEVTRQLLAFSRRQMLSMQVIDLNQVLAGMVRMLRHIIGEDVALAIDAADDLGAIRADTGQLEQIIMNLAANARDAMPRGGTLTLSTANIDLALEDVDDTLGIPRGTMCAWPCVDDGWAMSPHTLEHLFEPFFTTKQVGQGTGLGLASL